MSTIFEKIINGEIPSYKIYEDEKTCAFLDIHPETRCHTLVVPKLPVDKVIDLPDDYYSALWDTVRKVAKKIEEVSGSRALMKVVGTDVPHAHVHIVPLDSTWFHGREIPLSPEEFREIQAKLKLN